MVIMFLILSSVLSASAWRVVDVKQHCRESCFKEMLVLAAWSEGA